MDLDIVDIESELMKDESDDFLFSSSSTIKDDEINEILNQWKRNDHSRVRGIPDSKFDSRTFTRPKRRLNLENDPPITPIIQKPVNLKIGGLVTSMQKSFLQDTSPPISVCSSISMCESSDLNNHSYGMENSLITSGDFTNVSFLNNLEEIQTERSYKGYDYASVMQDRKLIENLSKIDENILSKDLNISKTDNFLEENNSESSTLENSEDFTKNNGLSADCSIKLNPNYLPDNTNDQEEKEDGNSTFVQKNSTFGILDVNKNSTFDLNNQQEPIWNKTFEKPIEIVNKTFENIPGTFCDRTFDNSVQLRDKTTTNGFQTPEKILDTSFPDFPQSTPIGISTPNPNKTNLENISPILLKDTPPSSQNKKSMKNTTYEKILNNISRINHSYVNQLEEERRSLTNFEEFEKSMLILEDNKNEKEFDDILNSCFSDSLRKSNEKMKMNVDNIKKRHSIINSEKQQEEQRKKDNLNGSMIDSNKLTESLVRSMNSSSGSERLLNRRSRLNEEPTTETTTEETNQVFNTENVKNNRDRFKTIRIFRKPQENVPVVDDENFEVELPEVVATDQPTTPVISSIGTNRFSRRDNNSPKVQNEIKDETEVVVSKKRTLSKPRFFSGLLKRTDYSQKSNSADDLLDRNDKLEQTQSKLAESNLKSPMGIKSKSVHNLVVGNNNFAKPSSLRPLSKFSYGTSDERVKSSNSNLRTLRQPQTNLSQAPQYSLPKETVPTRPVVNSRLLGPRKTAMARPVSAYYSYNVKRNDSDTESKSVSQDSLSSSSSSRGGSNPPENLIKRTLPESQQTVNLNETVTTSSGIQRPSGLRPPSMLRQPTKSGLPRPMTRR